MQPIDERVFIMIQSFEICNEAEEVGKVLAINDATLNGVMTWIGWSGVDICNSFMGYAAEGSQRLTTMFSAQDDMVKIMMQAGVYPEGEFSLGNTANTMREAFLDTLEAMACYHDIHTKAKELYYHKR